MYLRASNDVYMVNVLFTGHAIKMCISYEEDDSAFLNVQWDVSYQSSDINIIL